MHRRELFLRRDPNWHLSSQRSNHFVLVAFSVIFSAMVAAEGDRALLRISASVSVRLGEMLLSDCLLSAFSAFMSLSNSRRMLSRKSSIILPFPVSLPPLRVLSILSKALNNDCA